MTRIETDARELLSVVRQGRMEDVERQKLAVLAFAYGMKAAKAGQPDREKPRGGNDETAA